MNQKIYIYLVLVSLVIWVFDKDPPEFFLYLVEKDVGLRCGEEDGEYQDQHATSNQHWARFKSDVEKRIDNNPKLGTYECLNHDRASNNQNDERTN